MCSGIEEKIKIGVPWYLMVKNRYYLFTYLFKVNIFFDRMGVSCSYTLAY